MLILYTPLDCYRPLGSAITHQCLVTPVNFCCFFAYERTCNSRLSQSGVIVCWRDVIGQGQSEDRVVL